MTDLEIYVLNVGQADTSIVRTPSDGIVVIDAVKPKKIEALLKQFGAKELYSLVVTHPHTDHYSGVSYLLENYPVRQIVLAPTFWFTNTTSGYNSLFASIKPDKTEIRYLSGYERIYPEDGTHPADKDGLHLELVGPAYRMLDALDRTKQLSPNHFSIISRVVWGEFSMVLAGDAQMENWANYDESGLLRRCSVLKAAHHGSMNGTQWERLTRLKPGLVVVSSEPDARHKLPDSVGSATFKEYCGNNQAPRVVLTEKTGTVRVTAKASGSHVVECFQDSADENVNFGKVKPLSAIGVDWQAMWRDLAETRLSAAP